MFREELSSDVKANEAEPEEAQQMYIVSKYLPTTYLLTLKKEILTLLGCRNPADTTLTKWSKLTSPTMEQADTLYLLMWCTEKHISSEVILPKMQKNKKKKMRKQQTNSNQETFCKITDLNVPQMSMSWKTKACGRNVPD